MKGRTDVHDVMAIKQNFSHIDGLPTKETNVAHASHHPKNPLKFSQIHSKRGN